MSHYCFTKCLKINLVLQGVFWRQFVQGGAEPEAWMYLSVAVPVACITGPIGSMLASHCHRQVLAWAVYILDTIALVNITIFSRCVHYVKT